MEGNQKVSVVRACLYSSSIMDNRSLYRQVLNIKKMSDHTDENVVMSKQKMQEVLLMLFKKMTLNWKDQIMKFQSKLDFHQNLRLWRDHRHNSAYTKYESLNQTEKTWLMKFNGFLRQLEEKHSPNLETKFNELQARILDQSDWLMDFNLEYAITFYLHEDDPEFEEDDDNILVQIQSIYFHPHDFGFGITHENYAASECFSGEHHCYTYHELYDHYGLDWRDLFRIGDLYFEIKIDEQSGMLPVSKYLCRS